MPKVTRLHPDEVPPVPPLWDHQQQRLLLYRKEPRWIHRWEPRTGKTRLALEEIIYWSSIGYRRFFISTSKEVLSQVWEPDCQKILPPHFEIYNLFTGDSKLRMATLFKLGNEAPIAPQVLLVNHENLPRLKQYLLRLNLAVIVLDEVHEFMNPSGARHKVVLALSDKAEIVRGLTGTPVSSAYVNVYGIYKVVDSRVFGTRVSDFNARYVVFKGGTGQVIDYINVGELKKKMASISDEVYKKDCFDMPKELDVYRDIRLSPKLMEMYREVAKEHVLSLEGKEVTFDHLFARLSWLQQFAGGYLPERQGVGGAWYHNEKINACLAEVRDILASGQKVVILHRYVAEGERLAEAIGYNNATRISGQTKGDERVKIVEKFNTTEYPKVLIVQQKIGSVGISLRGANYIIFYSTEASHLLHDQGVERIFKEGSDYTLTRIYLTCYGTVDKWFLNVIRRQRKLADALKTTKADLERLVYGGG